jgi:hypothetical protein
MSKKAIVLLLSIAFLAASILYSYSAKKEYIKAKEEISQQAQEIKKTIALKKLWSAKGLKKKIENILKSIPNKRVNFKRKSVDLVANNLSYRELNYLLNKFASMPLQFQKLQINKVGSNFNLECLCEW